MMVELSEIDDEHLHIAVVSPDRKVLAIQKGTSLELPNVNVDSDFGYIVINGRGSNRTIESEDSIEFDKKLEKVLKNPRLKIIIV